MDDMSESDPIETEAAKWGLKYIGMDGNIACFGTDGRKCEENEFLRARLAHSKHGVQ